MRCITNTSSGDISVVSNPFPLIFKVTQNMRLSPIYIYIDIIPRWEYLRLRALILGGGDYEQPIKITESVYGKAHVEKRCGQTVLFECLNSKP